MFHASEASRDLEHGHSRLDRYNTIGYAITYCLILSSFYINTHDNCTCVFIHGIPCQNVIALCTTSENDS